MALLALPDQCTHLSEILIPERAERAFARGPFSMYSFETVAVEILRNYPQCTALDGELRYLIAACMAVEIQFRPNIVVLHEFARRQVQKKKSSVLSKYQ
ncbi:hypothetical protein F4824DRAFT_444769 [Ustulina deusta]|nr:hypothetical protein F4823DRAFT_589361 [Ustulina deusta]KAI3343189.1 hypothetical protein F4824DRAFT_444769 [Ustulina deusta]